MTYQINHFFNHSSSQRAEKQAEQTAYNISYVLLDVFTENLAQDFILLEWPEDGSQQGVCD